MPRRNGGNSIPPKATRILIAGNAEYGSLAMVRALQAAGYTPWLAVDKPGIYAARSRVTAGTVSVHDPELDSERFVREVAAAAARFSVVAVLPGGESYLLALAGRDADFAGVALGAPSRENVQRATDKELLTKLSAAAGLRTPPTEKVTSDDSATVGTFGFPAIVKPRRNWMQNSGEHGLSTYFMSYHNVRCVSSDEEAQKALKALPGGEGLVQKYVPGQLISVVGVSWGGELYCALHQAAVRMWPPLCGGSAYAETIPPDTKLEQGVARLLQAISWSGLFQAQFVRSQDGEHYLIDLNPRIYGTLALAVAAGLDLPVIWADLLLGRRPDACGYRVGTYFRNEENDSRALARMLMDGELRSGLRGLVPHRRTTHAIFALHDPMPLLTSLERMAGQLRR